MTFDAIINMKATDNASPVVDSATKNILANWKVMKAEVRSTTAEFQLQNQTLVAGSNAFRAIGSVASSAMNIYTQFTTMQIRMIDTQNSLILAQLNYNQVLASQGPGTNDAIAASIQLQEAKQAVAQATQQETIGYIGMGLELGSVVSQMVNAIPTIENFIKKLQGAQSAANAANAVGSVGAAGPMAGIAGAGGAAGGKGKFGMIGKGIAGAAGAGLIAGGLMTGGEGQDFGTKLASVGQSALGGAMLGGTIGSIVPGIGTGIGAGVGGAAGLAIGIAQNFGQEITDWFNKAVGGQGGSKSGGIVQHVVTVKIENATDHRVSATESSMGIEQVMGSNNP